MKQLVFLFLLSFLVFSCSPKKDNVVEPSLTQQAIIPAWADVDISRLMGNWKVKQTLRSGSPDNFSTITNFAFDKNGTVIISVNRPTVTSATYFWQYIKMYHSDTKKYDEPQLIIGKSFYINSNQGSAAHIGLKSVDRQYVLTFLSDNVLVGIDGYDVRFTLSK
jgi:hypothetical protein